MIVFQSGVPMKPGAQVPPVVVLSASSFTGNQDFVVYGNFGSASLNGVNQEYNAMSNADFQITTDWTFSGWFWVDDFSILRGLVSKGNPVNAGGEYSLTVAQTTGIPRFAVRKADNSGYVFVDGPPLTAMGWHFIIAWVELNGKIGIRVDLSTSIMEDLNTTVLVGGNDFRIGSLNGASFLKGRVDICSLHNRLLDPPYEADWMATPRPFVDWGQVGDDGADLLTDLMAVWEFGGAGDAVDSYSGNDLTQNNSPGTAQGPVTPITPIDYIIAVDKAALSNATLVDFADAKASRSNIFVPSPLRGLSLRIQNATPADRITVGPLATTNVCSYSWWMYNVSGPSIMLFGDVAGLGAIYFDNPNWVYRDGGVNVAAVSYAVPFGAWHLYGISRNAGTVQFFVDGVQIGGDQAITGSVGWSISNLVGPTWGLGAGETGDGYLDDMRRYEAQVLTALQYLELLAGEEEVTGAAFTNRWSFNEGF